MSYESAAVSDLVALPGVPAIHGPAHPIDYPEIPYADIDLTGSLGFGADGGEAALNYLNGLMPGTDFSVLSTEGSTAVVLEDDANRAFKVIRNALHYSAVEEEMAALQLLHLHGVGPQPHVLIDTAMEHRVESQAGPQGRRPFSYHDVTITRQEGTGQYPVIVMERLAAMPLGTAPKYTFMNAFDAISKVVLDEGLLLHDTELVYDPRKQDLQLMDVGCIWRYDSRSDRFAYDPGEGMVDMYPGIPEDELRRTQVIIGLLAAFRADRTHGFESVHTLVQEEGLAGVRELVSRSFDQEPVT